MNKILIFERKYIFFYLIFLSVFLFITIQNFIFSSNFSLLYLREIDDLAFQQVIRNIHLNIQNLEFLKVLQINDFGYGWFFWILTAIITYPFYLMLDLLGPTPIIVIPRELSLCFSYFGLYFIYKSVRHLQGTKLQALFASLFTLSFPTFLSFSMRFGTVSQLFFFCTYLFYLSISLSHIDKKAIFHFSLIAGMTVGTKLNGGLFVATCVLILTYRQHKSSDNFHFLKKILVLNITSAMAMVVLANPSLLLSYGNQDYLTSYTNTMTFYLKQVSTSRAAISKLYFIDNLIYFFKSSIDLIPLILIAAFAIYNKLTKKNHTSLKIPLISLCLSCVIIIFVIFKIKMGPVYAANYLTMMSWMFSLSVLFLGTSNRSYLLITIVLILNIGLKYDFVSIQKNFNPIAYFEKSNLPNSMAGMNMIGKLNKLIKCDDDFFYAFVDYRAPFSPIELDCLKVKVIRDYDNTSEVLEIYSGIESYKYIVQMTNSNLLTNKKIFNNYIAKLSESQKEMAIRSRNINLNLLNNNLFQGILYSKIAKEGNIIVYERID